MAIKTIAKRRCDRCGGHVAEDADRICITEHGPARLRFDVVHVTEDLADILAEAKGDVVKINEVLGNHAAEPASADMCERCAKLLLSMWTRPQRSA